MSKLFAALRIRVVGFLVPCVLILPFAAPLGALEPAAGGGIPPSEATSADRPVDDFGENIAVSGPTSEPSASTTSAPTTPRIPMIAVTNLQAQGVSASDAAVFTESLGDVLLRSGTVRVMERSQMDKILAEQGFQSSGACDTAECAVQIGRLLGIDQIVVGSVGKVGETYSLSVRLVDVATGEVSRSSRRIHRGAIDDVLERMVPEVGNELVGAGGAANSDSGIEGGRSGSKAVQIEGESRSSAWLWWTAGGVALVGGAAAAVLLLADGEGASSDPGTGPNEDEIPTSADPTIPVTVTLP
ncbi:MAG: DUF2380 domain-containing protein [Fibrobacteria bacterium]|nr:DUF2380 domain-containing protein [Fibrobacteria bacterium]